MSLVSEMKSFLVANGQGSNLFQRRLPDAPPAAMAIRQYQGRAPQFAHNRTTISVDRPALQVLVRDTTAASAEDRIMTVYALLATVVNETIEGTFYQRIEPLGAPVMLEREPATDRAVYSASF